MHFDPKPLAALIQSAPEMVPDHFRAYISNVSPTRPEFKRLSFSLELFPFAAAHGVAFLVGSNQMARLVADAEECYLEHLKDPLHRIRVADYIVWEIDRRDMRNVIDSEYPDPKAESLTDLVLPRGRFYGIAVKSRTVTYMRDLENILRMHEGKPLDEIAEPLAMHLATSFSKQVIDFSVTTFNPNDAQGQKLFQSVLAAKSLLAEIQRYIWILLTADLAEQRSGADR